MRIKKYVYAEVKEELEAAQMTGEKTHEAAAVPLGDEFGHWFYTRIRTQRNIEKAERQGKGLCMTLDRYEAVEDELLSLAERIGMDVESDIQNGTGMIRLVFHHFDLHKKEEPELLTAIAQAVREADYMYLGTCERYGETLVRLELQYDLNV